MTGPTRVSAREAEVLAALAGGRSNAQIARHLHISARVVESHVSSSLRKYGVADRHELAGPAELSETDHRGFTALASPRSPKPPPGSSGSGRGSSTRTRSRCCPTAEARGAGTTRADILLNPI